MQKLTILFDADNVAENLLDRWLDILNKRYEKNACREDVTCYDTKAAFPTLTREQVYAVLKEPELWAGLEPMPWAVKVLEKLHAEGHELYMVTASDFDDCIQVKMNRIMALFPWLDKERIIIAHNKRMIHGDVLIDDYEGNLTGNQLLKILLDWPHNRGYDVTNTGITRAQNWLEVYMIIQDYINQVGFNQKSIAAKVG